ncbi:hypothetical protein [Deinococcus planocerae]|uniref:hypothetical protein n=1 Tax=Deinococcus planocerae TaxID=1737569 RepID=UPI0011AECB41|nr:hypothetical protein [Deinococcus planocerae]
MKEALRTLRDLLSQLLLALIGQPVPGLSEAERRRFDRKRGRLEKTQAPVGPVGTLRTVAREVLYVLFGQPSPEAPSSASRRRPRS